MTAAIEERPAARTAVHSNAETFAKAASRASTPIPAEFLNFRLGAEEYGIHILRAQEIRSDEAPTRIANAPSFIKGVVNLRGVTVRPCAPHDVAPLGWHGGAFAPEHRH